MKRFLIHIADLIDNYLLRHRLYSVCDKIGKSSWWGNHQCNCWYCLKLGTDADWRSEENHD